jgi:cytochrome c-type biogenesis protein CcmH/NrfF
VGVLVGDWTKESNLALWLLVTPLVLAIVGALVLPATRRRRRSTAG